MWKLNKNTYRYVNITSLYVILTILIVPITVHLFIEPSTDLFIYKTTFGFLYAILFYFLIFLIVPPLIWLFKKLKNTCGTWISFFIWIGIIFLLILVIIKLDPNLVRDSEDISNFSVFCSLPIFLWMLFFMNECQSHDP